MGILKSIVTLALMIFTGCTGIETGAQWLGLDELDPPAETGDRRRAGPPENTTLRIVTFNIRDGGVDPAEMAAAFRANQHLASADVVLLQEAVDYPEEQSSRTSRFATELGMTYIYAPARPDKTGTYGNAIISRYPLQDFAVMHLPLAPGKRQRIAVGATIHVGTIPIRIVTPHLDVNLNVTDRILQLRPAVIDLPEVALVGGDYNSNPYAWEDGTVPLISTSQIVNTDQAPILDNYMAALGFTNPTAGDGPTNKRLGIESRLDAVFVRGLDIGASSVERNIALSDHWPVWVDVTIRTLP